MKLKPLGRTGLEVSEICLGTMTWGSQNSEAQAHDQLDYALANGVNFIDTAEMYAVPPTAGTYGRTETILGPWLARNGNRARVVLASKVAGPGRPWVRGGSAPNAQRTREAIEGSLRRLRTDHIDLYQIHWPSRGHYHFDGHWDYQPHRQDRDTTLPHLHEMLETMGALVKEGKIGHFGVSNETAWGLMQYLRLAEQHGLPRLASVQNEYNLLRRYFDSDLAEIAHHEDIALMAYSPLASGVLTGKYLDGALPPGTRGALAGGTYRNNWRSEPPIRAYLALAQKHGLDVTQMAIAFCLGRPFVTATIVGATSLDQLKGHIAAAAKPLDDAVLAGIRRIHMEYPRPL